MRQTALLLALAAAAGCGGLTGPDEPASAYVRVTDQDGRALVPDRVVWYYDPQSARYDGEHPAECLNRLCTLYGVPEEVTGATYVAATRVRPYPGDALCEYVGYDGRPVTPSADDPPTVTLRLDTEQVMCA